MSAVWAPHTTRTFKLSVVQGGPHDADPRTATQLRDVSTVAHLVHAIALAQSPHCSHTQMYKRRTSLRTVRLFFRRSDPRPSSVGRGEAGGSHRRGVPLSPLPIYTRPLEAAGALAGPSAALTIVRFRALPCGRATAAPPPSPREPLRRSSTGAPRAARGGCARRPIPTANRRAWPPVALAVPAASRAWRQRYPSRRPLSRLSGGAGGRDACRSGWP